MRVVKPVPALAALLFLAACDTPTAIQDGTLAPSDAAIVAAVSAEVGALGEFLTPALAQTRARAGNPTAHAVCADLERLRLQLQDRLRCGDGDGAAQARLRLRVAAAEAIRAGLGDGPITGMLADNDALLVQLRARIQERARLRADTAGDQERLRSMTRLQEQARLACQDGRHGEGLELAARVREQLRTRGG